jgi:hypothetical protein
MGWCSGTEYFDLAVDALLKHPRDEDEFRSAIVHIYKVIAMGDWDCEPDSKYFHLLEKYGLVDDDEL